MIRPRNRSQLPNMWPKIYNLQFKSIKKLYHYFGAKFYGKSNGESCSPKTMFFNPVEMVLQGKGFVSAANFQKPEGNFFNLFTR